MASPHHLVREEWLALTQEEVLAPEQAIFDAHHHLWHRSEGRYQAKEFMDDVNSGHDVRASLFIQCKTGYHDEGPTELRPVGEVETIIDWCKETPNHPVGLVGFADLQLGEKIEPVLDILEEKTQGKLCGIRNTTAFHPETAIRSNPNPPPDGLLRSKEFIEGAKVIAKKGLVLDVWAYQTQLDEVQALAKAVPDLIIVVDHCGGPLGVGSYNHQDPNTFKTWQKKLAEVAAYPNTRIKIGGFGLSVFGWRYAMEAKPPHSSVLAADWSPWIETCINLFETRRAMFESNFPVDKGQFSYCTVWNAFKRVVAQYRSGECDDLFWRSAAKTYGINNKIFTLNNRSIMS
ncbi:MAG: amidohydrolase family protein [Methylocystaceae bacterium]|nr:amidohydrolase family protein [Methylocystaceae bacterium]